MCWPTLALALPLLAPGSRGRPCLAAAALLLTALASVPVAARQAAIPTPQADDARARLEGWRRRAEEHFASATTASTAVGAQAAAWRALVSVLETLANDAAPPGVLRDDLRADVGRVASRLRDVPQMPSTAVVSDVRAVLDRLRLAVAGDVALGLAFQGSFSQTPVKEPVSGGHASAMGPAPAATPAAGAVGASTVVSFHERTMLPTRTWNGGPTKEHILESPGNGVALVDVDGDGWLDIYLVTAPQLDDTRGRIPHRNALYRNLGNWQFEDVSAASGADAAAWGNGVCAGDANGDGHVDLYVTNWGPNFLFRNRGDGRFVEAATAMGVAAGGWSTGCAFLDADGDGDLDLYVARYVDASEDDLRRARRTRRWRNGPAIMVGPTGLPGQADLFFENLGDGRFREAAESHGLLDGARAYGFGVVVTDVDDDGAVDVFVANDSQPNFLYRNRGDGHFESVGLLAGVAVNAEARAQAGMGVDAGDADGDGRMDLALTAFAHDRNTLYRNLGNVTFEDVSLQAGLAAVTFERMGWGVAFLDADLDGKPDLFVANGHIFADVGEYPALGEQFAQKNQLLINTGATFRDVSAAAGPGLQVAKVSRGLAVGDLDNDGDPDVVISNMDETPTLLENRQASGRHWVTVRLTAPSGNRLAIGARVTVTADGVRQVREVRSGGSFMSQGDLRVQVGLGPHAGPVDVEVRLPGGARWRWRGLPVDRLHDLALTRESAVSPARPPGGAPSGVPGGVPR